MLGNRCYKKESVFYRATEENIEIFVINDEKTKVKSLLTGNIYPVKRFAERTANSNYGLVVLQDNSRLKNFERYICPILNSYYNIKTKEHLICTFDKPGHVHDYAINDVLIEKKLIKFQDSTNEMIAASKTNTKDKEKKYSVSF